MAAPLPLQGLRVLDLASFIAGPVATTVMGDYGAEVIKIEPTHEGGPPAFSLPAQGDQMAGMNLFAAISMALLHRERTGQGSEVSTSLHAGGLWSNAMLAQGALLDAYVAPRPPRTKPRSALAN